VAGAVLGSLVFGYMTDRFGCQRLFFITLAIYLVGVGLTAFSWNLWSFALFRFMTGSGIGGEYAAMNSFLYNAIFFTYALVLTRFYNVLGGDTGMYLLPFAVGNFLGPLILGHLFDTIGRREMISGTYTVSALLLVLTGYLFTRNDLSGTSQTILWTVIFFFASPAASSAYLTVSEIFPLEIRALAIALFFSIGTGAGGIVAPWLFGVLIESGSRIEVLYGYLIAGALMLAAAVVVVAYGVKAERMSLERVAQPLSSEK
jgi:MFS family permease